MIFLQEKGITPALAARIYKRYRSESLAIVQENPYRIADDIWGVGFKTADGIALKLGFQLHAPQRIASGILYVIGIATGQGHLYIELKDLRAKTLEILELNQKEHEPLIKQALHTLYNKDKIRLITEDDTHYITLTAYLLSEKGVASRIKRLIARPSTHEFDVSELYHDLRIQRPGEEGAAQ